MLVWNDKSSLKLGNGDLIGEGKEVKESDLGKKVFEQFKKDGLIIDSKKKPVVELSEVDSLKKQVKELNEKLSKSGDDKILKEIEELKKSLEEKDKEIEELKKSLEEKEETKKES